MINLKHYFNAKSFLFGLNPNLFFSLKKIWKKCFPLALTKGPVDVIGTVQVSRGWKCIAQHSLHWWISKLENQRRSSSFDTKF